MIVLDTNIVIYYLKDNKEVASWLEKKVHAGENIILSTMTVVELLSYPLANAEEKFLIERFLESVLIISVDISIAREAARIRSELKLKTVDSVIAATAVIFKSPLITRDVVFKKIRDIQVISP